MSQQLAQLVDAGGADKLKDEARDTLIESPQVDVAELSLDDLGLFEADDGTLYAVAADGAGAVELSMTSEGVSAQVALVGTDAETVEELTPADPQEAPDVDLSSLQEQNNRMRGD